MTRTHATQNRTAARLIRNRSARSIRPWLAPAAAAAIALGLSSGTLHAQQQEGFTSLSSVRFFLSWQEWGSRGFTGKNTVIANIDAGHPVEHQAFKGKVDLRIGWPFLPAGVGPNTVVNRNFSSMHATATVGALVSDARIGFTDVQGLAPDATVISASAGSGFDPATGGLLNFDMTALTFAVLAVSDQDFADSIASLLGVEPWQTATVINMPVWSIGGQDGQSPMTEVVNMAASQLGVTVVTPAGDLGEADFLDNPDLMQSFPGTVGEPGSAQNALTVGRTDATLTGQDDDSGRGPNSAADWFGEIAPASFIMSMDCNGGMAARAFGQRAGPQLVAPGTRIGLPGSPIIPATSPGATSVLFDFWEGTSFASSLVAGAVALVHDAGTRFGLPINSLVTKAVILNSASKSTVNANFQSSPNMMAEIGEDDAEIFSMPWNDDVGLGGLDLRRLLNQYIGPIIDPFNTGYTDILPGDGRIQFGEVMLGPDIVTPTGPGESPMQEIRETAPCIAFVDCGTFALKPVDIDMLFRTGRLSSRDCPLPGKSREDCEVGFISRFVRPGTGTGLGGNLIPPPGGDPGLSAPPAHPILASGEGAAAPVASDPNRYDALQTPLVFPAQSSPDLRGQRDPPLFGSDDGRLQNTAGDRVTTGTQRVSPLPGGSQTNRITASFGRSLNLDFVRTGWDYGTIGTGSLDIPIGFVPDEATINITLVWEREHRWDLDVVREAFLEALAAPQPLPFTFRPPRLENVAAFLFNPTTKLLDQQTPRSQNLQLASPTRRLRLENLDLELWRASAGGGSRNQLIARSSAMGHNTFDHISVGSGDQASTNTTGAATIISGFYFLRITWGPTDTGQGTLYDLGGTFAQDIQEPTECASFEAKLPEDPFNTSSDLVQLDNMFAGNVDYAVAWYVEAPRLVFGVNFGLGSGGGSLVLNAAGDANADGAINNIDLNLVMGAIGTSNPSVDFDSDGEITAADVSIVLQNFGQVTNSGKINKISRKGGKIEGKIASINADIAAIQREMLALANDPKKLQKSEKKIANLERKREKMLSQFASLEEQLAELMGTTPVDTSSRLPSIFAGDRN